MATIRPFSIFDTLNFNNINLDLLTETVKPPSLQIKKLFSKVQYFVLWKIYREMA